MTASREISASDDHLVWYAGYGSNLLRARFERYISGGTPEGSTRVYPGCRDKAAPRADRPIKLQGDLYFADRSQAWGGAVAFFRPAPSPAVTYARMYLITYGQFNDVVRQENGREVPGRVIVPPFDELARADNWLIDDIRLYGRLMKIGIQDGRPILTFSATHDDFAIGAPSEAYVKMIAAGLAETYPCLPKAEMLTYLRSADGVRNTIPEEHLTHWVLGM